jgi:hypothetical protein
MKFLKIENDHLYFQEGNYFGKLPISASKTVLDKLAELLTNQNGKPMDANLREIAGLTPKELYETFGDAYINVLMTQQNSVQVHEDEALSVQEEVEAPIVSEEVIPVVKIEEIQSEVPALEEETIVQESPIQEVKKNKKR